MNDEKAIFTLRCIMACYQALKKDPTRSLWTEFPADYLYKLQGLIDEAIPYLIKRLDVDGVVG